jgi:FMN phosphatase YigB (HAD superfamily)
MKKKDEVVFLLDVDNTLLDHDRVVVDLRKYLHRAFGQECQEEYWSIFEQLRSELGYADYLGALQRYRVRNLNDPNLLQISNYLINYPFANRLYPSSLDVLEHLRRWGKTVILTDGDVVFQPLKVSRSGLFDAVEGRVLIYIHKELQLEDVMGHYPAGHYVMVDDKIRILTEMKKIWRERLTTVFVNQGHYARDPEIMRHYPPADISLERISDLLNYKKSQLLHAATTARA